MTKNKILMVIIFLFLLSAIFNVLLYNKSQKYEQAVDDALSYFTSEYRVGSIHRTLKHAMSEGKLYYGEKGKFNNYYQGEFQKLSSMHSQLTLLYGPIYSFEEYSNISSIGTRNLFNMYVDFSLFFEYLGDRYYDSLTSDKEGQYISISDLDEDSIEGIRIIVDITGELDSIRSQSYEDLSSNNKKALQDFLKKSAQYFNTQEVQEKVKNIESIIKKFASQASG